MSRDIRVGASRALEFRLDMFNAFNTVVITNRQDEIQFVSPTDLTIRNSQTLREWLDRSGAVDAENGGLRRGDRAMGMRTMQMQVRFRF